LTPIHTILQYNMFNISYDQGTKYKLIIHNPLYVWWVQQIYSGVFNDAIPLFRRPCEKFIKIYELDDHFFNKLNNKPYLNYEWEMKMKEKHMNQNIVIIPRRGQTNLFCEGIIHSKTKLSLITSRGCKI
jgi:hypothetical protein